MTVISRKLVQKESETYVVSLHSSGERKLGVCLISSRKIYGREKYFYVDSDSGEELFPGKYFDHASKFRNGYACVIRNGKYLIMNISGIIVHRWRFSDVGFVNPDETISVQHPRCLGWSLLCLQTGKFLINPPRYRR